MEEEEDKKLSDTVLCVRYDGTADARTISAADFSGNPGASPVHALIWTPGYEIPWEDWERIAGSRERALEVLQLQHHEFSLVGPGADDLKAATEVEEFDVGGPVEE